MIKFPGEFAALVKHMHITTMPLDGCAAMRMTCIAGRHRHLRCEACGKCFHTEKALQAHQRVRHQKHSKAARYIGTPAVCPFCCIQFSSRTRLIAHLSERRVFVKRCVTCGHVVRAGLVAPVPVEEFDKACAADRTARSLARKRGNTQPISDWPAKRLCTGGSLASASAKARTQALQSDAAHLLTGNVLDWSALRPVKLVTSDHLAH